MNSSVYIVTGMHRSGTSLMTRMLEVFDFAIPGDLVGPAPDNEKGFFEDRNVIAINDDILQQLDLRWDSLHGFFLRQEDFTSPKFNVLKHRASTLLKERKEKYEHWVFKDPRMSRLTGFWQPLIESEGIESHYLISIRNPNYVAGSLAKRNQFSDLKSLYLWFLHTADVIASSQGRHVICHYEDLLQDPKTTLVNLGKTLGLEPSPDAMQDFCDDFLEAGLDHNASYACDTLVEPTSALYNLLRESIGAEDTREFNTKFSSIVERYLDSQDIRDLLRSLSHTERDLTNQLTSIEEQFSKTQTDFHKEEGRLIALIEATKKDYESLLELQRQKEQKVAEDLAAQIEQTHDVEKQVDQLNEDLKEAQSALHADAVVNRELNNHIELQREELKREQADRIVEETRLWEIVEKYRMESETHQKTVQALYQSFSWRITAPVRAIKNTLMKIPVLIWRALILPFRWLVHHLPADSKLRQSIIWTYERFRQGLQGEIDTSGQRRRHRQFVDNRLNILGEKPQLDNTQLPDLSISVVTYNSSSWINRFVTSLLEQSYPLDKISLTFVDNDSSDDTVRLLHDTHEKYLKGKLATFDIIESANEGYGAGHHQAITLSNNDFVLVTNIDLEFTYDCLVKLVSFAVQDEADVASWECRQQPFEHPKYYDPVTLETAWSSHACILIRQSAYLSVGGYEQKIFMYGEDVELSYRFTEQDYKLRYLPQCTVFHHTYQEEGEVKPLQFEGSTLANAYIRLRYGSLIDILGILPLYSRLWYSDVDIPNVRSIVKRNIRKVMRNAIYFLRQRKNSSHGFAIRHWDYDLTRDGAFYTCPQSNQQPQVSVVTRTFQGRESLLRQAIQSVMHQTYQNVELIVVEDGGSTQRKVVEELQLAYPSRQINYLPLKKVGRCNAGNSGLAESKGKYIMFLDDDDLLFSDHIECCVSELETNDDLGAVYALGWEVETAFSDDQSHPYEEKNHITVDGMRQEFDRDVLTHHNFIAIQSILFRRTLYEQFGGFDPDLENLEDWNMWVRYSSECEFKLIRKTTSMYRTPWDLTEKATRQSVLNRYYEVAQEKNARFLSATNEAT